MERIQLHTNEEMIDIVDNIKQDRLARDADALVAKDKEVGMYATYKALGANSTLADTTLIDAILENVDYDNRSKVRAYIETFQGLTIAWAEELHRQ